MAVKWLLDTNVVLYHLGGKLAKPLPSGELFCSVINELELLSPAGLSSGDEAVIREALRAMTILDLSEAVREETIRVRRAHKLKLPDAIIVASAVSIGATVLTNDEELLSRNLPCEGVEVRA